ncbi:MAG: hypothetical protein LKI99_06090 [Acetobacter fabarum]|jgi:hypothetical protein|nr:hypothetical protein [Acetobacter fabarum]MCI1909266.1 hypothetical protein [Acetobacter fabarum]MCI1927244.1 hypothetical protein [Acetobacter fabarum]MCI1947244.1 hypothetical protein [Acetobacter fabarum]MCI1988502.1 hypothetical protein [Acetobacter fabarum]
MNAIATYQPAPGHKPSPDLSALLDAVRSNVAIMPRDLTAQRVAEARALAAASVQPAAPELIVAWLKKLALLVVNGPDAGRARSQAEAMVEICGELPAAVWCPETRKAWCQQGDKGKFWPAPAELYAHLLPYAERIRRDAMAAQRVVSLAEQAAKPRATVSAEERAAVAAQMAAWCKRMGYPELQPDQRRPEQPQPGVSERLAEYRRQLAAEPEAGVWLAPLIAKLEAQVGRNMPKEPRGLTESAEKALHR